jgi:methionyl aminopeptidase
MQIESEKDLQGLKRIGAIVAEAVRVMAAAIRPGITTAELDQIGAAYLARQGARPAPPLVYGFPGAICISLNDEAAHGIPGSRVIQPGDLINLDVSAELDGYFGDTGASFGAPPVSLEHQKLLDFTRRALERAVHAARGGRLLNDIGRAVEAEARRGGFNVIRSLTGHGVGRSIHEEPRSVLNFSSPMEKRILKPGMVLTIEPFLTPGHGQIQTGSDGWTLKTADGAPVAQFEHTLVITPGRPIVITI